MEDLESFELCLRIFEPMDPQADLPLSFFLELETTAGSAGIDVFSRHVP